MPIKPIHIILSRILSLLGLNYIYAIATTAPAIIVYIYDIGFNLGIFIVFILMLLFLPVLSMTFSMMFGWLIAWISSKVAKPKIIIVAFSLIFMLAYFLSLLCMAKFDVRNG